MKRPLCIDTNILIRFLRADHPEKVILDSLSLFSSGSLAFIDCWISCVSKSVAGKLITFDKKLERLTGK